MRSTQRMSSSAPPPALPQMMSTGQIDSAVMQRIWRPEDATPLAPRGVVDQRPGVDRVHAYTPGAVAERGGR